MKPQVKVIPLRVKMLWERSELGNAHKLPSKCGHFPRQFFSKYCNCSMIHVIMGSRGYRLCMNVITTAQLHSTKSELRFCTGSNPANSVCRRFAMVRILTLVPAGNKAKLLSLISDQKLVANKFNTYFTNVAQNL